MYVSDRGLGRTFPETLEGWVARVMEPCVRDLDFAVFKMWLGVAFVVEDLGCVLYARRMIIYVIHTQAEELGLRKIITFLWHYRSLSLGLLEQRWFGMSEDTMKQEERNVFLGTRLPVG